MEMEQKLKEYLDNAITNWRTKVQKAEFGSEDELIAMCYVDAFQSVRVSVLGELLPSKEDD